MINLIQNPDKSLTIALPDENGLVRSVTGPASMLVQYTWKQLCKWGDIDPSAQFCCFSSNNPWNPIHSELVSIVQEQRHATCKAK